MDRWELLLELPGHHADVQALAISQYGDFVITGEPFAVLSLWLLRLEPDLNQEGFKACASTNQA
jgi:U3 small nucleolar RNA-associated protein 12